MKLKKLEIYDKNQNLLRSIELKNQYYLIGEVEEEKNKKTSNALGKTVFLQMISYCLCGNITDDLKSLQSFYLKLFIEKNSVNLTIERRIGEKDIIINEYKYSLETAKSKLDIDRNVIHHLIHFDERNNIILDKPNKFMLYQAAYSILGMNEIIDYTAQYYNISEKIDQNNKRKKVLSNIVKDDDEKVIIEKELGNLNEKLNKLSEMNEEEIKIQNEEMYHLQNTLKSKKNIILANKYDAIDRIKIISDYIQNLEKVPKNILEFIRQANEELADTLNLKIEEAIDYHAKLSAERTEILQQEMKYLKKEISEYDEELIKIERELPSITKTIKNTNEIKKLFEMQNQLFERKQNLILANQSLLEMEQITREIELLKQEKTSIREKLIEFDLKEINKQYLNYSNELVKKLYPNSYRSHFDIKIVDFNRINNTKLPITFDFRINKDNSEGVRNARNLIVDILMFKYSKNIEFMAWDSNTFNGIDPNQLIILFKEISEISKETGKQAIICFNSFQLGEHYLKMFANDNIPDDNKIIFNNSNTLLNIEF